MADVVLPTARAKATTVWRRFSAASFSITYPPSYFLFRGNIDWRWDQLDVLVVREELWVWQRKEDSRDVVDVGRFGVDGRIDGWKVQRSATG